MLERQPGSATRSRTSRSLEQFVDIETPEQVVFSWTVAGVGSRAAAALLDHAILIGALILLVLFLLFVIGPATHVTVDTPALARRAGGWLVAVILVLQFVAQWGYYVLFEALMDGQTPGKRWLGLRVVQDGGYSVSFAASAARNIARAIDMQPAIFYIVGLIAVAASKSGKRLGDHLAGTLVVRERLASPDARASVLPVEDTAATHATPVAEAALSDDELDLLQRFVARTNTLAPEHARALASRMAQRFRADLRGSNDLVADLRELLDREVQARARGAGAHGMTGASREQYALLLEGQPRWNRFAQKLAIVRAKGLKRLDADEVAEFLADYREMATDLARLATASHGRQSDALFRLTRLVAGGHNLIYRQERLASRSIQRFFFVAVPAELRRSVLPILGAALLLFGSGATAWLAVVRNPSLVEELVPPGMIDRAEVDASRARSGSAAYIDVEDYARPIVASSVFRNNVQVTFFAFASGLTAGVFTVLILLMNGISIGAAIGLFQTRGVAHLILEFIVGHSVFELSAICIAAGAGFIIAGAILVPGARTRGEALVAEGRRSLRLLAAAGILLLFAGAIEGLISPRTDLGLSIKITVAAASALAILAYTMLGRATVPSGP
jgi:uncharacterized membrane protein SpoIIM required for sporulation/uncharacterized RDD family membrane protein YckC